MRPGKFSGGIWQTRRRESALQQSNIRLTRPLSILWATSMEKVGEEIGRRLVRGASGNTAQGADPQTASQKYIKASDNPPN